MDNSYSALCRIMTGDLALDENSFYPETELPMLKNSKESRHYPGLEIDYNPYPVKLINNVLFTQNACMNA